MSFESDLDTRYGDSEDEQFIKNTEIISYEDYKEEFEGVFLVGNGFSVAYSEKFDQSKFEPPSYSWKTETVEVINSFLFDNTKTNISYENEWEKFRLQLHKLFRESFVNPIIDAHKGIYDIEKINQFNEKLCIFNDFFTINYDLIFEWLKRENVKYLHGSINLMVDDNNNHIKLEKYGINVESDFTDEIINTIKEIRKNELEFSEVYGGNHFEKLSHIHKHKILEDNLKKLKEITGTLVIFGCSIDKNDIHIWNIIDENTKIDKLFISIYNEDEIENLLQHINSCFPILERSGKITIFNATSFMGDK